MIAIETKSLRSRNGKLLSPAAEAERSIIKKFRKTIWNPFVGGIKDYHLIQEGDAIAVCISGGKDSMLLAKCMQHLQKYSEIPFSVQYLVMDPGYTPQNRQKIVDNAARLEIPIRIFDSPIFRVVEQAGGSPCYLCARMRRGILHNLCLELGISKLALGHHFDDAVQTFFMNLFYGGKIGCFSPKTFLSRKQITVIRPLVFCEEREIKGAARRLDLPVVKSACPADGVTARKDTEELVKKLEKDFPHLRQKVLGAMQRAGLDGW